MRADSGLRQGFGHAMRCITLGQELVDRGYRVTLLGAGIAGLPATRAHRAGVTICELVEPDGGSLDAEVISELNPDLLVADSYELDSDFFVHLDEIEMPYVVFDDNREVQTRNFQLLINQNVHADKTMYPDISEDRLLLGCRYAMIRREVVESFQRGPSSRREAKPLVLVALGGSDLLGYAPLIAEKLLEISGVDVVVAGRVVPIGAHASPEDISRVLIEADVALVGAGSTLWETCFLGVPAIALVVADNQVAASSRLAELGVISHVDARADLDCATVCGSIGALLDDETRRQQMAQRGQQLVDGLGAHRVAERVEVLLS